jgi:hypothetical protein
MWHEKTRRTSYKHQKRWEPCKGSSVIELSTPYLICKEIASEVGIQYTFSTIVGSFCIVHRLKNCSLIIVTSKLFVSETTQVVPPVRIWA